LNFTKLEPGRLTKFQETLLAPAFSAGSYIASIWIPSTDPLLRFDSKHNFLFSSNGVPDPATGLKPDLEIQRLAPRAGANLQLSQAKRNKNFALALPREIKF